MKTTILPSFTLSLTRAMTALMLLTSACDQGAEELLVDREGVECTPEGEREPTEAQTLAHFKEIVVSDGHNEVTLLVASENPELIERYNDETFEIVPVFERPELTESEEGGGDDKTQEAAHDFSHSVLIEEVSVSLQDGAIGYELREVDSGFRNAIQTCMPNVHTSAADYATVAVISGPCTEARISTRRWSWKPYVETAHKYDVCPGGPSLTSGARSNRLMVEVCPGSTQIVSFIN